MSTEFSLVEKTTLQNAVMQLVNGMKEVYTEEAWKVVHANYYDKLLDKISNIKVKGIV